MYMHAAQSNTRHAQAAAAAGARAGATTTAGTPTAITAAAEATSAVEIAKEFHKTICHETIVASQITGEYVSGCCPQAWRIEGQSGPNEEKSRTRRRTIMGLQKNILRRISRRVASQGGGFEKKNEHPTEWKNSQRILVDHEAMRGIINSSQRENSRPQDLQ